MMKPRQQKDIVGLKRLFNAEEPVLAPAEPAVPQATVQSPTARPMTTRSAANTRSPIGMSSFSQVLQQPQPQPAPRVIEPTAQDPIRVQQPSLTRPTVSVSNQPMQAQQAQATAIAPQATRVQTVSAPDASAQAAAIRPLLEEVQAVTQTIRQSAADTLDERPATAKPSGLVDKISKPVAPVVEKLSSQTTMTNVTSTHSAIWSEATPQDEDSQGLYDTLVSDATKAPVYQEQRAHNPFARETLMTVSLALCALLIIATSGAQFVTSTHDWAAINILIKGFGLGLALMGIRSLLKRPV